MAQSGIARIDDLLRGVGDPITPGNSANDADAVGAIQDLLTGHGYKTAGMRQKAYGKFGPATQKAVKAFRKAAKLAPVAEVDQATLTKLISLPATRPIASRAYLTLVLDRPYDGYSKLVSMVAIVEGAGKFAALNANTDQAGLSVGIIQWAQKPKRLAELVKLWDEKAKSVIRPLLGYKEADDAGFKALTDHLESKRGGTLGKKVGDKGPGETTDNKFDLIRGPWLARFRNALLNARLQLLQVDAAAAAFKASHDNIKANMKRLKSERAVAFIIDLANQFGDGGAQKFYDKAVADLPGDATERKILEHVREASTKRLEKLFPKQAWIPKAGEDRRTFFLDDPSLSDGPFPDDPPQPPPTPIFVRPVIP